MKRVWNVTDDPRTDIRPCSLMIFQKSVAPGRYVNVPDARLAKAKKIYKDSEAGLVYIGDQLPEGYLRAKETIHLKVPEGHARAHGPLTPIEVERAVASLSPKGFENPSPKDEPPEEKEDSKSKKSSKYSFKKKGEDKGDKD